MEMVDIGLIVGLVLVVSGFAAWFIRWLFESRRDRRIEEIEDDLYRLEQTFKSGKGVEARQEKQARMQMAMLEVQQLMSKPNADMKEVIKVMAAKYPDLAADFLKKGMKGL